MGRVRSTENYIRTYDTPEVYGNVVRKAQSEPSYRRLRSSAEIMRSSKVLRKQKAAFVVLGSIAGVVVVALCVILLRSIAVGNSLAESVAEKEAEYEKMILANDAREYEINSSVDLNYIINTATDELAMVRSNASQIVLYSTRNSEYLQQVAKVPLE